MTRDQLIEALFALPENIDIGFEVYNGGEDVWCEVESVEPDGTLNPGRRRDDWQY